MQNHSILPILFVSIAWGYLGYQLGRFRERLLMDREFHAAQQAIKKLIDERDRAMAAANASLDAAERAADKLRQ